MGDKQFVAEESPASKLGIETISPQEFRRQIQVLASQDIVLTAVGPSGIGKTAIPAAVARDRGAPYVALHVPTMTPEDWSIPTMASDTRVYFDRRIPRLFQNILTYVDQMKAKHGGVVPADKRPILAIEELNRAQDKAVTRGAFVLIGDRTIGDAHIDENVQIVCTMNPSGDGMSVNEFERDPAMRRRSLLVFVAPDYASFIAHAETAGFHPEVLEYVRAHPSQFYDQDAARAGKAFACPATWERVSRVARAYETAKLPLGGSSAAAAYAGYIGTGVTKTFVEFVQDRTTTISPRDVIDGYTEDSDTRKRLLRLVDSKTSRFDRVVDLLTGVSVELCSRVEEDPAKVVPSLGRFINDLPEELMYRFFQALAQAVKTGPSEAAAWSRKMNAELVKDPHWKEALERYHVTSDKARSEAVKEGLVTS